MRTWPSIDFDSLAQLVEHRPFKALVLGSSPRGVIMKLFEKGDKVEVLHDDSNPQLKGKEGTIREQTTDDSPFWCTIVVEGKAYPIRGTSLKKLPQELDSE